MSLAVSVILFLAPLLCCFAVLGLIDHSLILELLANKIQITIATCLALVIMMILFSKAPFAYSAYAYRGIYTGIPGLGLMFMVLPGMGNYIAPRERAIPAGCWSLLGLLMMCAPLVLLFSTSR
ncbi:hypothetical protein [Zooshikella ganghwensis]|uniref:hypothetical protein n=1 Tax=Zooshikella ganghwensis TaxID=202772 RepID=UPI000481C171|nr:hypothetical protein [Zooshikella ganghwensis]